MSSVTENLARVRSSLAAWDDAAADPAPPAGRASDRRRDPRAHAHGEREMRFRFKARDGGGRDRRKRKRREERGATTAGEEEGEDAGLGAFVAHPLPRPAGREWLDPELDGAGPAVGHAGGEGADRERADPADEAFRASLFDALADDEGAAAYWEGVYAQPVHVYARPRVARGVAVGEGPVLEDMGDDEYVAYVKRRMWERANPGLVREMEVRREREEGRRRGLAEEVEAALESGVRRRRERADEGRERARWAGLWAAYALFWEGGGGEFRRVKEEIVWPAEPGRATRSAPDAEAVMAFFDGVGRWVLPFIEGAEGVNEASTAEEVLHRRKLAMLKAERIRWHPDKMLQRFGGRDVLGEETLAAVTAVFQVIDGLLDGEKKGSK